MMDDIQDLQNGQISIWTMPTAHPFYIEYYTCTAVYIRIDKAIRDLSVPLMYLYVSDVLTNAVHWTAGTIRMTLSAAMFE
jgi:hypothetical protein